MNAAEWAAAVQAAVVIINALRNNEPKQMPQPAPLSPEEIAAIDAAKANLDRAVAGWNLATGK
jgi:uncharacterized protein YdbL (DUF1318 family)